MCWQVAFSAHILSNCWKNQPPVEDSDKLFHLVIGYKYQVLLNESQSDISLTTRFELLKPVCETFYEPAARCKTFVVILFESCEHLQAPQGFYCGKVRLIPPHYLAEQGLSQRVLQDLCPSSRRRNRPTLSLNAPSVGCKARRY